MTDIRALLENAKALGADFRIQGGKIKIRAPEPLPDPLLTRLKEHRDEILAMLQKQDDRPSVRKWYPPEVLAVADLVTRMREVLLLHRLGADRFNDFTVHLIRKSIIGEICDGGVLRGVKVYTRVCQIATLEEAGERDVLRKVSELPAEDCAWLVFDNTFEPTDGHPVFYADEIPLLSNMTPENLFEVFKVKISFPCCRVVQ